jgi:hypothetical protein
MTVVDTEAYFAEPTNWDRWEGCEKDGEPVVHAILEVADCKVAVHLIDGRWNWHIEYGEPIFFRDEGEVRQMASKTKYSKKRFDSEDEARADARLGLLKLILN